MTIPVGLLFFAGLFIAAAVLFEVMPGEACLDQPCQSEGVDDSIASWGSSYFVAACCLMFALHLQVFRTGARKSAILGQMFVGASFILMGLVSMMHGNNGTTDNTGMKSFWIVTAVSSYALAFSACCHASFAIQVAVSRDTLDNSCVNFIFTRVLVVAVCAAAIANITGCVWCVVTPEIQTDEVRDFDADSLDFYDNPRCIQVASTSIPVMWFCYALLWIPMGGLLRGSAKELSQNILGLATGRAALLATVFQWSTGSMFLVIVSAVAWYQGDLGSNFVDLWDMLHGAEIFHFGILMTMYCVHNLAWTFPTSAVAFAEKEDSSTDDEEPHMEITDDEEQASEVIARSPGRRKKKSRSKYYDQDDGEISLWALLTVPESKKNKGWSSTAGHVADVSMLSDPTMQAGEDSTVRTDTSQMGNWFTNTIEDFFLGPKPSVAASRHHSSFEPLRRPAPIEPIVEEGDDEDSTDYDAVKAEVPSTRAASPRRATSPSRAASPRRATSPRRAASPPNTSRGRPSSRRAH